MPKIIYTFTDEAPLLATYSLLPMLESFLKAYGVQFERADISLAARVKSAFADVLPVGQRCEDDLSALEQLVRTSECCVIKLPNISASVSQLKACIGELQGQGYDLPEYPEHPVTDQQREAYGRYQKVLGSAVNPRLRDGNSDRRIPAVVKEFARPTSSSSGESSRQWDSRSYVASMEEGDFYGSEQAYVAPEAMRVKVVFRPQVVQGAQQSEQVLRQGVVCGEGDVIDGAFMSYEKLSAFFQAQQRCAAEEDVIYSLHLKATMMKVSDPHIFGCGLETYFAETFQEYGTFLQGLGVKARFGLKDVLSKLEASTDPRSEAVVASLRKRLQGPQKLAMVDSDRGISNFHVPSDIIIDASMAAMIRSGGKMWAQDGETYDCAALIPDRTYARIYQEVLSYFQHHGSLDPGSMGSLANVGLMAQKAQEYGSHPYTFVAAEAGCFEVVNESNGEVILSHAVEGGDIWRMCRTTDVAIRDWVRLALERSAVETESQVYFWLDGERPHDRELRKKVERYIEEFQGDAGRLAIVAPDVAMRQSLEILAAGKNVIAVTGNVLRDYLTDLFPILEVGTSAKMLSVVSLLQGGGLFETGSGGSAPKHVQQLLKENHLRWDSLGEMLALGEGLAYLARKEEEPSRTCLQRLSEGVQQACARYLKQQRYPSRVCGELGSRGSHLYFMWYFVESCAILMTEPGWREHAAKWLQAFDEHGESIIAELGGVQGRPVTELGGYYHPDSQGLREVMQPSPTLQRVLGELAL